DLQDREGHRGGPALSLSAPRGQREDEARALLAAALGADGAAVRLDDGAADREPEPGPAARALPLAARERLEHLLLAPLGKPRPVVLDARLDEVADDARRDPHFRTRRGVLHDVAHEAREDALDERRLHVHERQ